MSCKNSASAANSTNLVILLDRSGSMQSNRDDHQGGLRAFVEKQKQLAPETLLTFILFDGENSHDVLIRQKKITEVQDAELRLDPRGSTPLLDALGRSINLAQELVSCNKCNTSKGNVVFLIVTDGGENSSKEYSYENVKKLVKEKQDQDWSFTFLGTDIDSFSVAKSVGIDKVTAANYSKNNIGKVYQDFAQKFSSRQKSIRAGETLQYSNTAMHYSEEERRNLDE